MIKLPSKKRVFYNGHHHTKFYLYIINQRFKLYNMSHYKTVINKMPPLLLTQLLWDLYITSVKYADLTQNIRTLIYSNTVPTIMQILKSRQIRLFY